MTLRDRGMIAPELAVGDGALGSGPRAPRSSPRPGRSAAGPVNGQRVGRPATRRHGDAKAALAKIYTAETRAAAVDAAHEFARDFASHPKAVAKITDDWDVLMTFYDFPVEHPRRLTRGTAPTPVHNNRQLLQPTWAGDVRMSRPTRAGCMRPACSTWGRGGWSATPGASSRTPTNVINAVLAMTPATCSPRRPPRSTDQGRTLRGGRGNTSVCGREICGGRSMCGHRDLHRHRHSSAVVTSGTWT